MASSKQSDRHDYLIEKDDTGRVIGMYRIMSGTTDTGLVIADMSRMRTLTPEDLRAMKYVIKQGGR